MLHENFVTRKFCHTKICLHQNLVESRSEIIGYGSEKCLPFLRIFFPKFYLQKNQQTHWVPCSTITSPSNSCRDLGLGLSQYPRRTIKNSGPIHICVGEFSVEDANIVKQCNPRLIDSNQPATLMCTN